MDNQFLKMVSPLLFTLFLLGCSHQRIEVASVSTANDKIQQNTPTVLFNLPRTENNFPAYIEALKTFARENGISEAVIELGFADVYHLNRVITADKNQPEKKLTLAQYLAIAASESRLKLAASKMAEFHEQVNHAETLTGIPAAYIIALWGVESGYGRYQGKDDVISALATLAFEGRREAFFSRELVAALQILEKGYITKDEFKGSWAGAMGQNQFMPSSLLKYGKDGDGDGVIDIWTNTNDVLASIGNYLATVGWNSAGYWGNMITLPKDFDLTLAGLDNNKAKSLLQWQQLGIIFADAKSRPHYDEKAWLILPDADSTSVYLVYSNFKTLMHWNRSYFFAISVGMIADSLAEK
ncbi:lytic murein transglycosylase [Utexia brackfieldae]|uniref:lytic murein transglycosylase n=1 Tax=Utexia brackfieldae TaxID=3074108 RepID=UPI00370DC781